MDNLEGGEHEMNEERNVAVRDAAADVKHTKSSSSINDSPQAFEISPLLNISSLCL